MKFTFNTGRQYQPKGHKFAGQVITVETLPQYGNVVTYVDHSRGLDGFFFCVHVGMTEQQLRHAVMEAYDHNRAKPLDSLAYTLRELAKDSGDFGGTHVGGSARGCYGLGLIDWVRS